jgi:tRNA 2-selenouridine synthase
MIHSLEASDFYQYSGLIPIVDVRSPGEFTEGHITGSVNLPVLDNEQRAVVGTIYAKKGRSEAAVAGLDFVLPKIKEIIRQAGILAPRRELILHCWRGGLRSATIATALDKAGFNVYLLNGGYKAYRSYLRGLVSQQGKTIVLGGYTGSGKTDLLSAISQAGEQVIDLEFLAHHRGSAFGALDGLPQPTNEQFENNLFDRWHSLNPDHLVWLEDESRMIGHVTLPEYLYAKIATSPLIRILVPLEIRVENLVRDYASWLMPFTGLGQKWAATGCRKR